MAIRPIDTETCVGCGLCVKACPMDVIRLKDGKARVCYVEECMCCAACEDVCPTGAIYVSPEKDNPLMVSWR